MSVSLLVPMLGENNGTVFPNWSPSPKTITRYGDAKTVTSESKYYGSSAYFDGIGDYLTTPDHADFELGSGDFTIEAWIYLVSGATYYNFVGQINSMSSNNGRLMFGYWSGALQFFCSDGTGNTIVNFSGANSIGLSAWTHVAITKASNVYRFFINGAQDGDSLTNTGALPSLTGLIYLGSGRLGNAQKYYKGYLQDVRVTKGEARYTAEFTPPSQLLGLVSGMITDRFGQPCQRKVYLASRPTDTTAPQILFHGLSDPSTGAYDLFAISGEEVTRVVVSEDDDPLLNDLVDRVIPA
jgi:hypothetical protein